MMKFRTIPVSGGWKMAVNNYYDFNGKTIVDWNDPRRQDLNTTMLGLQSESGFVVDVGWTPEADINGNYRLEFLSADWKKTYFEYATKDLIELEKVLFPLLSLQKYDLERIAHSSSIASELLDMQESTLITTYLFSGWQMDVNLVYPAEKMGGKSLVFKCSELKRRLSLEIEIQDENQFIMKLKYDDSSVNEILFQDHVTIRHEINSFMVYFHDHILSNDFKLLLLQYNR
jgi:hypothetical protein